MLGRTIGMTGSLNARVERKQRPPWSWRLRNTLRRTYAWGWLANTAAKGFSKLTGIPTVTAELSAVGHIGGQMVHYGVLSHRVVTTVGVNFLVDDWDDDSTDITTMNFHASGEDNTAENVADTSLGDEGPVAAAAVAGVKSQPTANQLQSTATQSYTGTNAIVEHALRSALATGTGVLWDRSVFAVINVADGDSIAWTYTCTVNSGG